MSPGLALNKEDCQELQDLIKEKHYCWTVAKAQFAAYPAGHLRIGRAVTLGSSQAPD
jgi:hypothetical protein